MLKNIFATVGILAVVVVLAVWQFGFLSKQAKDASIKLDRATAAARAAKTLDTLEKNVDKLEERARRYRVEAKTTELKLNRQEEAVAKTESSIKKLAQAAKNAGLPKPGAQAALTDEQKAVTLTFGTKTIAAPQIYETLERWNRDVKTKRAPLDAQRQIVARLNSAAEQLLEKKSKTSEVVAELKGKLQELRVSKDLAEVNASLARLEANVEGVSVGDVGKVLDVLQTEIDELNATTDVLEKEGSEQTETLTPNDVDEPAENVNELDKLWDEEIAAATPPIDDELTPNDLDVEK